MFATLVTRIICSISSSSPCTLRTNSNEGVTVCERTWAPAMLGPWTIALHLPTYSPHRTRLRLQITTNPPAFQLQLHSRRRLKGRKLGPNRRIGRRRHSLVPKIKPRTFEFEFRICILAVVRNLRTLATTINFVVPIGGYSARVVQFAGDNKAREPVSGEMRPSKYPPSVSLSTPANVHLAHK